MHRALTMSRWGKCGSDTALTSRSEVEAMAMMDRQDSMAHLDLSESAMYTASTLHLHWMLFDYASFESMDPSNTCPLCKAAFSDPLCPEPLNKHLFTWHAQMGGCEGHDKCLQAHEIAKLGIKRLAVCKPDLGGGYNFFNPSLDRATASATERRFQTRGFILCDGGRSQCEGSYNGLHDIFKFLSISNLLHSSTSSYYTLRQVSGKREVCEGPTE
jgi:hypothetical protein